MRNGLTHFLLCRLNNFTQCCKFRAFFQNILLLFLHSNLYFIKWQLKVTYITYTSQLENHCICSINTVKYFINMCFLIGWKYQIYYQVYSPTPKTKPRIIVEIPCLITKINSIYFEVSTKCFIVFTALTREFCATHRYIHELMVKCKKICRMLKSYSCLT